MATKTIYIKGRRADPQTVLIGNEGDNLCERLRFELPSSLDAAAVFLHLHVNGYADVVQLDEERAWTPERKHTQHPGHWTGYLEAMLDGDVVWHSDPFGLIVVNLPDGGEQLEQQYPTAIEEALRAADTLTGTGARAETLPPDSEATVAFEEDENGNRVIVYGIPRGKPGGGTGGGGAAVPSGGKAGQYLRKVSDADGDVEWADLEIPQEYGLITYDQDKTITIT